MNIHDNISTLRGIGPKTRDLLNKCGIFTILDFILYFPREYEESECLSIGEVQVDKKVKVRATVKEIKRDIRVRNNMVITTIVFSDGKTDFQCKWFNQPYIKNNFRVNESYLLFGKLEIKNNKKVLVSSRVIKQEEMGDILPKYSLKGKLNNNFFMKTNLWILNNVEIKENLPNRILKKYNLCSLDNAIRNIHNPNGKKELDEAKRRLKFQELFTYSLKLFMLKNIRISDGIPFKITNELKELKERLPFKLTQAQNRVIREILIDEKKDVPMNRLVQGDVGSGKTIVAIIALFNVIKNGYQGVLMAPTEILAMQHFLETKKLIEGFDINIELISGSTTSKNKRKIKEDLKNGDIDIIVGTHALLEDDVVFKNLGMVITDEQHRFGVRQRSKLFNKEERIDSLVMTATPIPRTLALTLYGDLDVSSIDELPPGREKIDTYYIDKGLRERAYNFALKQIEEGRQVYVVCPLVEENEKMKITSVEELYSQLKESVFKNVEIGILHGKMNSKDKEKVMNEFKQGIIKALVSTTVIEVGVNVPNASLMIIESAERFGLSQLHQLRGRVGRGNKKSYCVLIADVKSETTKKRMEIMTKSNDGFYIAEEDLKLRGSGEVFGVNQHGEDQFLLSNLIEDIQLFKSANYEAKCIANSELETDIALKKEVLSRLEETSKYICFN